MLMALDGVDVVTKTKLCFCELVAPLLLLLLSVDLVDILFIAKRIRGSVFSELLMAKASIEKC